MSNRNRNHRQPRAGRPQVQVEASVRAGTLAEKLEEAGIKRETLPPGPAPQPKKEEKRPPSIGRAKSEIGHRGLLAGEKVLIDVLQEDAKGKGVEARTAWFILDTAKALGVKPWIIAPPTEASGARPETKAEILARFVETVLKGPNPASAIGVLRTAVRCAASSVGHIDALSRRVEAVLSGKVEDRKVTPLPSA